MASPSSVSERITRAQRLFLRQGMRSHRILLPDHAAAIHCWIPPLAVSPSWRPPLLLIHGFGWAGMVSWERQLDEFVNAGFRVYVPDLVSFGESTMTTGGSARVSVGFQAECLVAMLRELGVEDCVSVLGSSYGGLVAFEIAFAYPALVRKVVIASAGLCMDAADGAALRKKLNVDSMVNFLLPTTVQGIKAVFNLLLRNPPNLPDSTHQELLEVIYLKNRDAKVEFSKEAGFGTDKALSRPTLTQEVLLVWGDSDRLFDTDQGRKLQKHLGSRAQLVIVENAGHAPQSENSRAFNSAVLAFLKDESFHHSRL